MDREYKIECDSFKDNVSRITCFAYNCFCLYDCLGVAMWYVYFFFSALLGCFCFQGGWTMELNLYALLRCTILTMITNLTEVDWCQPGCYGTGSYTVCLGLCLMLIRFCPFVLPCLLSSSVLLGFWFIVWFIIHFFWYVIFIYYYYYYFY